MSGWIICEDKKYYCVSINELDNSKAILFAKNSVPSLNRNDDNIYDRYHYTRDRRIEAVRCGKLAEEAFAVFLKKEYNVHISVNYDIYEGTHSVDDNDLFYNGIKFDIKASKDTKNEGIEKCFSYFNFPVPKQQDIKDVTISVLYDNYVDNFYVVSWIDKDTYLSNYKDGTFYLNDHKVSFYKLPLKFGYKIDDIKMLFDRRYKVKNLFDKMSL